VTSRAVLERLAFDLFARQGFEETTVDDIAAAAGIGRRTFFRYFTSKNDLVWGDFEEQLETLRKLLRETDPSVPLVEAVRRAVVEFNRFDVSEVPWHRQRMELILRVPTLQADSTLRYASWRDVVRDYQRQRSRSSWRPDRPRAARRASWPARWAAGGSAAWTEDASSSVRVIG
jgi:mycofactocin system transcriptional regulator